MCDASLLFESIFSKEREFHFSGGNFPNMKFIGWFCVNTSPSIILLITSILFFVSLFSPSLYVSSLKNSTNIFKVFYFPYILVVSFMFCSWVWHSFDLGQQSLCHFRNATCGSSCQFEGKNLDILIENIRNIISWRPTLVTISFILPLISIPLLYIKINNIFGMLMFLIYFSLSLFFGIASFYVQRFCGAYKISKCDCLLFSTGMTKLCSIPFFELSIFVSICYFSYLMQHKRVVRKKRAIIHVNNSNTQYVNYSRN